MSDEARVFITVTNFVSVNEAGEEINSCYGFTVWDGETNHFFVASRDLFPSAAEVFEALRAPDALKLIENIDNYDVGFAEIARMAGGFSINALALPKGWKSGDDLPKGEWIEVDEKPRCFGHYPYCSMNSTHDREFECDYDCGHEDECQKQTR